MGSANCGVGGEKAKGRFASFTKLPCTFSTFSSLQASNVLPLKTPVKRLTAPHNPCGDHNTCCLHRDNLGWGSINNDAEQTQPGWLREDPGTGEIHAQRPRELRDPPTPLKASDSSPLQSQDRTSLSLEKLSQRLQTEGPKNSGG